MLTRMWINQPSNRSQLHHLHGTNVLVHGGGGLVTIYFTSGPIISMQAYHSWLSPGWR